MDKHTTHVDDVFRLLSTELVHVLTVSRGPRTGLRFEVSEAELLIGRSEDAAVDLKDAGISHRHCTVVLKSNEVLVTDHGSRNGSWLDGERVVGTKRWSVGSRLQVGATLLKHEIRSRDEIEREDRERDEIERAVSYVQSLLPQRIRMGPVRADWSFAPSAHLGGDAFGYHYVGEDHLVLYILDVCGHGAAAALHSVALLNVLRRRGLGNVDFMRPDDVLAALNATFPMDTHGGMYFTIWYAVYQPSEHRLTWTSAGHPPALLVPSYGGRGRPLGMESFPAGMMEDTVYPTRELLVPPQSRLYLYSDGAFDFPSVDGSRFSHPELMDLLGRPPERDRREVERVEQAVRSRLAGPTFEDDFSLVVLEFD
jgi:serine phosphatase RsbU (regulator of sigma subunit)